MIIKVALSADDYEVNVGFKKDRLPDFCLAPQPIELSDNQAVACFFQAGNQIFRANATYGVSVDCEYFFKISGEYLTQKLGFNYQSGRSHRWVAQGAVGAACSLPLSMKWFESIDLGLTYSSSASRKFNARGYQNDLIYCRIAGANAIGLTASTALIPWNCGLITGQLLYDSVSYRRHFKHGSQVQGLGFGIDFEQSFNQLTFLAGIEVHKPYIFYHLSLSSPFLYFNETTYLSLYAERVHGLHHLPNSSRIGIEFGFAFGPISTRREVKEMCPCPTPISCYIGKPAVYMPQVLVIKDQKFQEICDEKPQALGSIGTIMVAPGTFQLDVKPYFSQSMTLIYGASDLPVGFQINPLTGVLSGISDGSISGSFQITIFATNYCGIASQTVTLIFN